MKLYRVSIKIYQHDEYPHCEVDFIKANDENEASTKHNENLVKKFPNIVETELKSVVESSTGLALSL